MKPLFNSYSFIFVFLPVLTAGFYLIPAVIGVLRGSAIRSARKWFLIAISLAFYACFGWRDFFIFAAGILINGLLGCAISKLVGLQEREGKPVVAKAETVPGNSPAAQATTSSGDFNKAKMVIAVGVLLNIGFLAFFKYAGYLSFSSGSIVMPLAVSFYTFQQISFLVDVYRGEIRMKMPGAPRSDMTDQANQANQVASFSDYLLYITYFPKILEGPIVRFHEMKSQFDRMGETRFDGERFLRGLFLFTPGLAKKVLLADTIAGAVDYGFSVLPRVTWLDAVVVMFGYTLQLYLDFSGYCDMGAGVSRMIGIDLPENFHLPYKARSIAEFWDRWHMTLSRFFTKYLYIPLGGNRRGRARTYLNIMIVFLISGIWHGAGWTFFVWGFMHGALSVVQRALSDSRKERKKNAESARHPLWDFICTVLTFVYVSAAWMFFRADSVKQALELLKIAFSKPWLRCSIRLAKSAQLDEVWYALKVLHLDSWKYSGYICMWLVLAVSAVIAFAPYTFREISEKHKIRGLTYFFIAILFAWCVISLGGVSTFLYFKF